MITTTVQPTTVQPKNALYKSGESLMYLTSDLMSLSVNCVEFLLNTRSRLEAVKDRDQDWIKAEADPIETTIISLENSVYALLKPIPVNIDVVDDDDYMAVSPETGIAISADTAAEALQSIKVELVETFDIYRTEANLGPEPTRQLAILETYFGEKER